MTYDLLRQKFDTFSGLWRKVCGRSVKVNTIFSSRKRIDISLASKSWTRIEGGILILIETVLPAIASFLGLKD